MKRRLPPLNRCTHLAPLLPDVNPIKTHIHAAAIVVVIHDQEAADPAELHSAVVLAVAFLGHCVAAFWLEDAVDLSDVGAGAGAPGGIAGHVQAIALLLLLDGDGACRGLPGAQPVGGLGHGIGCRCEVLQHDPAHGFAFLALVPGTGPVAFDLVDQHLIALDDVGLLHAPLRFGAALGVLEEVRLVLAHDGVELGELALGGEVAVPAAEGLDVLGVAGQADECQGAGEQ